MSVAIRGATVSLKLQRPDVHGQPNGERIEVKIPAGVKEGSRVRVRGKGSTGRTEPGDLYIRVHVKDHPYFRREGNDIHVEVPISITEAALGAKVDVPTLDSRMTVTIPAGTNSGQRLRLRGQGVKPASGSPGDLHVLVKVVTPKGLSDQARDLLEQFDKAQPFEARANVPWK